MHGDRMNVRSVAPMVAPEPDPALAHPHLKGELYRLGCAPVISTHTAQTQTHTHTHTHTRSTHLTAHTEHTCTGIVHTSYIAHKNTTDTTYPQHTQHTHTIRTEHACVDPQSIHTDTQFTHAYNTRPSLALIITLEPFSACLPCWAELREDKGFCFTAVSRAWNNSNPQHCWSQVPEDIPGIFHLPIAQAKETISNSLSLTSNTSANLLGFPPQWTQGLTPSHHFPHGQPGAASMALRLLQ